MERYNLPFLSIQAHTRADTSISVLNSKVELCTDKTLGRFYFVTPAIRCSCCFNLDTHFSIIDTENHLHNYCVDCYFHFDKDKELLEFLSFL